MNTANTVAFVVFPYIALTVFVVGHAWRYVSDPFSWNARSSEFLEKKRHFWGITLFHYGVLLTLLGHTAGLLVPQSLFDAVGINARAHTRLAYYTGFVFGLAAFAGCLLLLWRRQHVQRVRVTTTLNDYITLAGLAFVTGAGLYNVAFGHFDVLDSIAPWIRGIVTFSPQPGLMEPAPFSYKLHVLSALALLGFSPFSRLVHIWSAPVMYLFRPPLVFRRRVHTPTQ